MGVAWSAQPGWMEAPGSTKALRTSLAATTLIWMEKLRLNSFKVIIHNLTRRKRWGLWGTQSSLTACAFMRIITTIRLLKDQEIMMCMPIMDLRQGRTLRDTRRNPKSIIRHRATCLVQVDWIVVRPQARTWARDKGKTLINVTFRHPLAKSSRTWIGSYNSLRPRARGIPSVWGGLLVQGSLCWLPRIATLFGILIRKPYLWKKCSARNSKLRRLHAPLQMLLSSTRVTKRELDFGRKKLTFRYHWNR